MFRNVYLKTLRDYRVGILGWGLGMGLVLFITMASVVQLTATPQARAELVALAGQFAWSAEPIAVDTAGGYAMFKVGVFIFLMLVWPLLMGSRALRGEEERGSMDVLLSLPHGRSRVAIEKVTAIWTALFAAGALVGLVTYAGGRAYSGDFGLGDALVYGFDLALLCAVIAGIALVLANFTSEAGTAAGWTGGLLLLFIVLDMVHRVFPEGEWISRLSPMYYFGLSKPLVPSYGTSVGGLLVLLVLALALSAVAVWLFVRRDVGATTHVPSWVPRRTPRASAALPDRDWSLRSYFARSVAKLVMPTILWGLLISGLAAWLVVVVKQVGAQLERIVNESPMLKQVLTSMGGSDLGINAMYLSAMFQIFPLILMFFVVVQVNGWASDDENGRLDMVLATPQQRVRVILARFIALSSSVVVIGLLTLGATVVAARTSGVPLDEGHVAAASLGMVPLGLLIGAIGYLGAGWLRTAADTGLLSFLLVGWFFVAFLGRDLDWPDATLRLTPFYYYGNPLVNGLDAGNVAILVVTGAVALVIGVYRFTRKDIAV